MKKANLLALLVTFSISSSVYAASKWIGYCTKNNHTFSGTVWSDKKACNKRAREHAKRMHDGRSGVSGCMKKE